MTVHRRKNIFRKVRFCAGIFLLLAIVFGLLVLHAWRKLQGPPPTSPGKCTEFDKHLAEINDKWFFVFEDQGDVVVSDIYGHDEKTLTRLGEVIGEYVEPHLSEWHLSPDNRWLFGKYLYLKTPLDDHVSSKSFLLRLKDQDLYYIEPENLISEFSFVRAYWLATDTLLIVSENLERMYSNFTKGQAVTHCVTYDPADLDNPRAVDLPLDCWQIFYKDQLNFDEKSRTLLFFPAEDAGAGKAILAYDSEGLRRATREEVARFNELASSKEEFEVTEDENMPDVDLEGGTEENWLTRLMFGIKDPRYQTEEMKIGGRVVRRTAGGVYSLHGWPAEWDADLELLLWGELQSESQCKYYIMDREGHYRFWHRGMLWGKFPRIETEREETEQ